MAADRTLESIMENLLIQNFVKKYKNRYIENGLLSVHHQPVYVFYEKDPLATIAKN